MMSKNFFVNKFGHYRITVEILKFIVVTIATRMGRHHCPACNKNSNFCEYYLGDARNGCLYECGIVKDIWKDKKDYVTFNTIATYVLTNKNAFVAHDRLGDYEDIKQQIEKYIPEVQNSIDMLNRLLR